MKVLIYGFCGCVALWFGNLGAKENLDLRFIEKALQRPTFSPTITEAKKAYLGVYGNGYSVNLIFQEHLRISGGWVVHYLDPWGPAAQAGLKKNDIILKVDEQVAHHFHDITQALLTHQPGDVLTLEVLQKGQKKSLSVILGEQPLFRLTAKQNIPSSSAQLSLGKNQVNQSALRATTQKKSLTNNDFWQDKALADNLFKIVDKPQMKVQNASGPSAQQNTSMKATWAQGSQLEVELLPKRFTLPLGVGQTLSSYRFAYGRLFVFKDNNQLKITFFNSWGQKYFNQGTLEDLEKIEKPWAQTAYNIIRETLLNK